ncbi:MAG: malate synthase A [Rhodanobacteraceae bacterium]|nr:MAG: malate synthase A [Rhodanobacteraceae bacterium]
MAVPMEVLLETPDAQVETDLQPSHRAILDAATLALLAGVHRRFDARRRALLAARAAAQARYDAGDLPDFRADTRALREAEWTVAPIPAPLLDRRVEITGPVDRKMVINALNSGANVFMADFEDSTAPTWDNLLDGQVNLRDAVAGTITFRNDAGREYQLHATTATLMVRPRGWHLPERHVTVDGEPVAGALFDFTVFACHNARALAGRGLGPYFYLPKLQSMEEAALWDDVMEHVELALGLAPGTFKVTVLIETLPAAFQMDEILHALRRRCVGLNCGRWDYIFSYLKTLRAHADRVLPARGQVQMTVPFLRRYSEWLIHTCHRRGAFAMGGMAAQIPIKGDAAANDAALAKVRADKLREVTAGHDGTWVAHPALVPVAREVFDAHLPAANQLRLRRDDVSITREALLAPCGGTITQSGFDDNVEVALRYLAAWLDGQGCVPIRHLMEDAATAEIARAQLWQWLHHPGGLDFDDGAPVTTARFEQALVAATARVAAACEPAPPPRLHAAAALLGELVVADTLADFLTLPAYPLLH